LVIVVIVMLIGGMIWRARRTRRLTIEESVDQYRRTLGAVHDAAARSRASDAKNVAAPRDHTRRDSAPFKPLRFEHTRPATTRTQKTTAMAARATSTLVERGRAAVRATRRTAVVAAMAVVSVAAIGVVIAAGHGKPSHRATPPTTTRPRPTHPTTTTSEPASTTTVPLVAASGSSGTSFTVAKASYTIAVQATSNPCWIDLRNPAGTALFSGTLGAGESQTITTSNATLRIGNPAAVKVTVDGTSVPFSLTSGSPLTLHFQGVA
jgi:cytoskeletal protein RodZ